MKRAVTRNFIWWAVICAVLLAGMCPRTDPRLLCPEESGLVMNFAPAGARQNCVWAREAAGQRVDIFCEKIMRSRLLHRDAATRQIRFAGNFCQGISLSLPGVARTFYGICCAGKGDALRSRKYIILYMHDLDGRKKMTI